MNYWLRLYTSILDDPKVQRLPAEQFKGWVNLLCLAKENDGLLPSIEDIAFRLRLSDEEAQSLVEALAKRGLLDVTGSTDGDIIRPHNWHGRQFKSDAGDGNAAERMRQYRKNHPEVSLYAVRTPTVTEAVTETVTLPEPQSRDRAETEQSTESETEASPASRAKPRSARRPVQCDEDFLLELQNDPTYAGLDVQRLYHKMVNWCSVNGKQPSRRRFINWLNREERPMTAPTPQNGGNNGRNQVTRRETPNERNAREYEELIRLSAAAYAASNGDIGTDPESPNAPRLAIDIGGH